MTRTLMRHCLDSALQAFSMQINQYCDRLESLNPRNVLARGYALVYSDEGRLVTGREVTTRRMEIEFADGRVAVERIEK